MVWIQMIKRITSKKKSFSHSFLDDLTGHLTDKDADFQEKFKGIQENNNNNLSLFIFTLRHWTCNSTCCDLGLVSSQFGSW